MVSIDQVCRGKVASELAKISTAALHKRVDAGDVIPVIQAEGKGTTRFFSLQQVLALRIHHEAIECGLPPKIARAALRTIEQLPNLEELVESGRHYLAGDGLHLRSEPMTRDECRKWLLEREAAQSDKANTDPISLEIFIDFGRTWRALKPLLEQRAAGVRRKESR